MNAQKVTTYQERELTNDEYDEILEEIYGDSVMVCGMEMYPPRVLRELDEVAYDSGKSEMMRYECTECGRTHDTETEAEDCCSRWECSACGTTFEDQDAAEACCQA